MTKRAGLFSSAIASSGCKKVSNEDEVGAGKPADRINLYPSLVGQVDCQPQIEQNKKQEREKLVEKLCEPSGLSSAPYLPSPPINQARTYL